MHQRKDILWLGRSFKEQNVTASETSFQGSTLKKRQVIDLKGVFIKKTLLIAFIPSFNALIFLFIDIKSGTKLQLLKKNKDQ